MNLIKALDNNKKVVGEKGHLQYDWSEDLQEKITEFYFQLVRIPKEKESTDLENKFSEILSTISKDTSKYEKEIILLYKITANTRDILEGKGEMDLCWLQMLKWWDFNKTLAYFMFDKIVYMKGYHQYGSWKDIKYFCYYIYYKTGNPNHEFIEYIVQLTNFYLRKLLKEPNNNSLKLLPRWVPREKSNKFGWLFDKLAYDYNKKYIQTSLLSKQVNIAEKRAKQKCKMEYRKLLAKLKII